MGAIIVAPGGGTRTRHCTPQRATEIAADPSWSGFGILRAPNAEPAAVPFGARRDPAPPAPPVPAPPAARRTEGTLAPAPAGPVAAVHPDARRFVLSTLRPLFEVLERRRPAKHLTAIASGTVVDVLRVLAEAEAAQVTGWGRVHVAAPRVLAPRPRPRTDDPEIGAEVFLTYSRGDRILAAAGRVESTSGRWRWVAFTTAA